MDRMPLASGWLIVTARSAANAGMTHNIAAEPNIIAPWRVKELIMD
jgi:hypothetical protein